MTAKSYAAALVKHYEGCRLQAYHCPAGVLTIGYGHTSSASQGEVITETKAEELLMQDIDTAELLLKKHDMWDGLSDLQQACLLSMAFNLGGRLVRNRDGSSTGIARAVQNGEPEQVPFEIEKWVFAGDKKLQGLVRRRAAEAALWIVGSTKG